MRQVYSLAILLPYFSSFIDTHTLPASTQTSIRQNSPQRDIDQTSPWKIPIDIMSSLQQPGFAMIQNSIQDSESNSNQQNAIVSQVDEDTIMSTYRRFPPPPSETENDEVWYSTPYYPDLRTESETLPTSIFEQVTRELTSREVAVAEDIIDAIIVGQNQEELAARQVTPKSGFMAHVASIRTRVYDAIRRTIGLVKSKAGFCKSMTGAFDAIEVQKRREKKMVKKMAKEGERMNSDASIKSFLATGRGNVYEVYVERGYVIRPRRGFKHWGGASGVGI